MEYVTMMKNLVQTGQNYLSSMSESISRAPAKAALVKIDRESVVRSVRDFNGSQLDIDRTVRTLTELIYLFNQKECFSEDEAVQIFFSITKLLQSEEAVLRRMVYMMVKEMRGQSSIYVVTSSLLKDIHHKNGHFRRNALRVIPMVIDASNMVQVERYIRSLIADADNGVASAALLSGLQFGQTSPEAVKKWGTEVIEKMGSKNEYVQYHALMLIGDIRQRDANAMKKTLLSLVKQGVEGIAAVQHLRMLRDLIKDIDYDSAEVKELSEFIQRQLRAKNEMVVIEAARVACECPFLSNKEMLEVVKVVEPFLVSESTVKKYAVLKIFNSLLQNESRKSLIVNVGEIQKVLKGKNTSLASIAASISLRICSEEYLSPLFLRLDRTMGEMSAEYKTGVIRSLKNVLKMYPKKHRLVNEFLLRQMREEGSVEIKSEILGVLDYEVVELRGDPRRECLELLARLIDGNRGDRLHFQMMGIISREANEQDVNSGLLRNIITSLFLSSGTLRACTLSTVVKLAQYEGRKRDALERTIQLFSRDRDQEVRDRIVFRKVVKPVSDYQLDLIEHYLQYKEKQVKNCGTTNILSIDTIQRWGAEVGLLHKKPLKPEPNLDAPKIEMPKHDMEEEIKYREVFANHPNFKAYGTLRKMNKALILSDGESELIGYLRIFLFDESTVLEFKIENRIRSSIIQNVRIELKHSGTVFKVVHMIAAKSIQFGQGGECYIGLRKNEECEEYFAQEKMTAIAKYTIKELTGEVVKATYEDEYSFDGFEIRLATYMANWQMDSTQFQREWAEFKGVGVQETFVLKYASTQAAQQQLVKHFGLLPIDNPQKGSKANVITVLLAGRYLGLHPLLFTLMIAFDLKRGCLLKIKVKADDQQLAQQLVQSLS